MNTVDFTLLFAHNMLEYAHILLPVRGIITSAHLIINEVL